MSNIPDPQSNEDLYFYRLLTGQGEVPVPTSRIEMYLKELIEQGSGGIDIRPDYGNKIDTVAEIDNWVSINVDPIEYTATEDCWVCGGVGTYYDGGSAPTPTIDNNVNVIIDDNVVGSLYHSHTSSSATSPINYFLRKDSTIKISSGNANTKCKAWIYAYGIG